MSAVPATRLVTGARVRRWAIASLAIGGSVMALAGEWTSPGYVDYAKRVKFRIAPGIW
jgi:hypothetical protein